MLWASRSSSGATAISCSSSAGREAGRQRSRELFGPRVAAVAEHAETGLGDRQDHPPAVLGVGGPRDQATRLERRERRAHRLRADLLEPGERGRGGRAAAVQARERRVSDSVSSSPVGI